MADLINEGNLQFIGVYNGTNLGRWFATLTSSLKLFIAFDPEVPFPGIYAKEIITDICNNEQNAQLSGV